MRALRTSLSSVVVCLLLLLACSRPAGGYSVLTHEEMIDLSWADTIRPLLLKRYPGLTPAQLREARAYAYGGCVIQDLGYYPFGQAMFSNLLHYVRTGDFVRALFRESKSADDLAFAIGALAHYLGDTIGHAEAINIAVSTGYPSLAAKYGANVNYAEGPRQHVRTEFAFDINDISKHRVAPLRYLNHVGFAVPVPALTRAFYDTYGLDLGKVLRAQRPTLKGYRFAVRSFLPRVAYAETLLNRKRMPSDEPGPALDEFNRQVAALAVEDRWAQYRGHAGFGTDMLAGLIFILPKFGPLGDLAIKIPTPASEKDYVDSLMHTEAVFKETLAQATHTTSIGNKDLDTGDEVYPGTYSLEDYAYADLLHEMTRDPSSPVPWGIKHDLLIYFADISKAKYIQANKKRRAEVEADLPILRTISTKAAYPETAFLPEPEEAKPDPTVPRAPSVPPPSGTVPPGTPKTQP